MAIDVGQTCEARASNGHETYTVIAYSNAANATGTIDSICFWQDDAGDSGPIDVASFADEGGDVFSTNGTATNTLYSADRDGFIDVTGTVSAPVRTYSDEFGFNIWTFDSSTEIYMRESGMFWNLNIKASSGVEIEPCAGHDPVLVVKQLLHPVAEAVESFRQVQLFLCWWWGLVLGAWLFNRGLLLLVCLHRGR